MMKTTQLINGKLETWEHDTVMDNTVTIRILYVVYANPSRKRTVYDYFGSYKHLWHNFATKLYTHEVKVYETWLRDSILANHGSSKLL